VEFTFSEDQLDFQAAVRDYLAKECPPEVVRASWSDDTTDDGVWAGLAEMGVIGFTTPEEHGGLGLGWVDLVLLLEETGRVALADPVDETVAVAAPLLAAAGGDAATAWLGRLAAGELRVAVTLPGVPYAAGAHRADLFVVGEAGRVVAYERGEVALTAQPALDGARHLATVAPSGTGVELATGPAADALVDAAFDALALGYAAQLLGLGARMLDLAGGYAKERVQFGVPIGSFQAVKHHLSNGLLKVDIARPVTYRAAHSFDTASPDRSRDVSMAKAYASVAGDVAARTSLQVHGAIGYTYEYDLQLFMKRAWSLAAAAGDAAWHRERVAQAVLDA
jgi:alkylation response protein AidB-like acyl-CoA dehydrogenase